MRTKNPNFSHHEPGSPPGKHSPVPSILPSSVAELQHLLLQAQSVLVEISKAASVFMSGYSQQQSDPAIDENLRSVDVAEAASRLNISRGMAYALMGKGELRYVQLGHRRRIPLAELQRILNLSSRAA